MRAFDTWWNNEGSGMPPLPGEEAETHVRRICAIAWVNGAYKANEAQQDGEWTESEALERWNRRVEQPNDVKYPTRDLESSDH